MEIIEVIRQTKVRTEDIPIYWRLIKKPSWHNLMRIIVANQVTRNWFALLAREAYNENKNLGIKYLTYYIVTICLSKTNIICELLSTRFGTTRWVFGISCFFSASTSFFLYSHNSSHHFFFLLLLILYCLYSRLMQ